jgi:hypothetical protein
MDTSQFISLVFYPIYVKVEALPILASKVLWGREKSNYSEKMLGFLNVFFFHGFFFHLVESLYNSTSELLQILLFRKSSLLFVGFCRGGTKQSRRRRPIQSSSRVRRFSKITLLQVILVCNYYPKTICFKHKFFC